MPLSPSLIDLTLTLHPGLRGVAWETAKTIERDGWNARTLQLYSHAGTHMDAPTHFLAANDLAAGRPAAEQTIDRLPLAACFGPAWVVDVPDLAPRSLLQVAHLGRLVERFAPGDSLLFRTGWSRFVDQPAIYRDGLPRIGDELAEWMVRARVKLLGVEPPSVADVNDLAEVTRIHRTLLSGGVTIVEGLTNLSALTSPRVLFAALPLKIEGGDGCPCRAFAVDADPQGWLELLSATLAGNATPSPPQTISRLDTDIPVGERAGVRGHTVDGVRHPLTPALSPAGARAALEGSLAGERGRRVQALSVGGSP